MDSWACPTSCSAYSIRMLDNVKLWKAPSDAALLAECEVETAVRLRHKPTGLSVIAEESRSQAENRARALRRLRKAIALRVRRPVDVEGVPEAVRACIDREGRLRVGQRDRRYLACAAAVLDVLHSLGGFVSAAAARLGLTTGNLAAFLTADGLG